MDSCVTPSVKRTFSLIWYSHGDETNVGITFINNKYYYVNGPVILTLRTLNGRLTKKIKQYSC